MARAGGENGDVASLQREDPALVAAEPNTALAARDAEHLMNPGVIVHVVVDAVAPGVSGRTRVSNRGAATTPRPLPKERGYRRAAAARHVRARPASRRRQGPEVLFRRRPRSRP